MLMLIVVTRHADTAACHYVAPQLPLLLLRFFLPSRFD